MKLKTTFPQASRLLSMLAVISHFSAVAAPATMVTPSLLSMATAESEMTEQLAFKQNSGVINLDGNEAIDPLTGALRLSYVDIDWPGQGGLSMRVVRTYSGYKTIRPGYTNEFGIGWSVNTMRLIPTKNTVYLKKHKQSKRELHGYVLQMPDGNYKRFHQANLGLKFHETYLSADNWRLQFSAGEVKALLFAPNGHQYQLTRDIVGERTSKQSTAEWTLTREQDWQGNFIDYEYESLRGANRLKLMKANDGRVIQFNYDRMHNKIILASIQAGNKLWRYQFDNGHLTEDKTDIPLLHKVIRPDGLDTQYFYQCYQRGCQIVTMISPTGGKTAYHYQTSKNTPELQSLAKKTVWRPVDENQESPTTAQILKRPNPTRRDNFKKVGEWRFQIPSATQKTKPCGPFHCVTSTVIGPHNRVEYRHAVVARQSDYISERGNVWQHGLLMQKTIYNSPEGKQAPLETQDYTWTKQAFSQDWQSYNHYVFDEISQRALLQQKKTTRDGSEYITRYDNFDSYGQPQTITQQGPDGKLQHDFKYTHDWQHWIISAIAEKNTHGVGVEQFDYDSFGKVIKHSQFGLTQYYHYDQHGQLTQKVDSAGRKWLYQDYHRGKPQVITRPDGVQLKQSIDDFGRVTAKVDAAGQTTHYAFDALDRTTMIRPPSQAATTIAYNGEAGPGGQRLQRGDYQQLTWVDAFGRKRQTTVFDAKRGELYTQRFRYDADGREVFASQLHHSQTGDGSIGRYQVYDGLNRLTETGTRQGEQQVQTTKLRYLPKHAIEKTDASGQVWLSRYRAIDVAAPPLLLQQQDPNGGVTQITRNLHGDILTVKQGSFTHQYQYNQHYHLTAYETPEAGRISYQRDLLGNKLSQTHADKQTIEYHYDLNNQLVAINYPDNHQLQRRYDRNGNLIQSQNKHSQWHYQYNLNGQMTTATLQFAGQDFTVHYAYDDLGHLVQMTYPDGERVEFAPDVLGRASKVGDYIKQVDYTADGQRERLHYANGTVAAFVFDPLQRLQSQSLSLDQHRHYQRNYQYDQHNRLQTLSDSDIAKTPIELSYDRLGRLSTAKGPWGQGQFLYDAVGNLLEKQIGADKLSYHYDQRNHLVKLSGQVKQTLHYDTQGNVIDDGQSHYQYNLAGELTQVNDQHLLYDPAGLRLLSEQDGQITLSLHDPQNRLLLSLNHEGSMTKHYYLNQQRVASRDGDDEVRYLHHDQLGSVIATTDADGRLRQRWHYQPFGQALSPDAEQASSFTGMHHLGDTSLLDFGHRYYHPGLGRFMNVDPVPFQDGEVMSFNRYSYALNNPYQHIDPTGEFAIPHFMRDFFDGFVFGFSWGGSDSDEVSNDSWGFYIGTGVGAGLSITGLGQTIRGLGLSSRTGKYAAEKLLQKKKPIWAESTKQSRSEVAYRHWRDHQHEFPELNNAKEYVEMARAQWLARKQQMSTQMRSSGDILFYDVETNTFTVFNAEGVPKTMFRPGMGAKYWGGGL